jgi:hypothetical protein
LSVLHIVEDDDDSDAHPLVQRAQNLLDNSELNEEDQAELTQLITRFKTAIDSDDISAEELENELLELIYFIEQNK